MRGFPVHPGSCPFLSPETPTSWNTKAALVTAMDPGSEGAPGLEALTADGAGQLQRMLAATQTAA